MASTIHAQSLPDDLTQLSLEELDALSISAAAKRAQPLFETPAAVSVLLPVDIRRAGHESIAESLRLVPGVHVINALPFHPNVGVRGGNGVQSTKLLVLVDGRSVYGPFYGSVEWLDVEMPLDDLARIEVVRGPGATLWGANAVNGIINVISKDARATQGALVSARSGSAEAAQGYLRYGGQVGANTWYRVSVSGRDTDGALGSLADDPAANYDEQRVALRTDSTLSEQLRLTVQTDHLRNHRRLYGSQRSTSILTRLEKRDLAGNEMTLQVYYDDSRTRTGEVSQTPTGALPTSFNEDSQNLDFDFTHHLRPFARHDIVWGGGARRTSNRIETFSQLTVAQPQRDSWLYNLFLQDEITIITNRLRVTLGSKFEHHDTIDWQPLPSARLTWTPNARHTLWVAGSRAVRAPSRGEREVVLTLARIPPAGFFPGFRAEAVGSPDFGAETVIAREIGWRWQPHHRFQVDLTGYHFDYDHVRNLHESTIIEPGLPPTIVQRYTITNDAEARARGVEASARYRISDRWEIAGGVARGSAHAKGLINNLLVNADYAVPDWIWHVRSWWQLPRDLEFSAALYGVGENDVTGSADYLRADAQLVWRPRPDLELALGIQNAGDPEHNESITGPLMPSVEVRRNVFARIQWRY